MNLQDTPAPRGRIFLLSLLGISLAINLLIAGAFLARWFDPRPHPGAVAGRHHMAWAFSGLTREERQEIRPLVREAVRESKQAFQRVRSAHWEIRELVKSEPLDEAALKEALARLRSETARSQESMHEVMLTILANLNPEQRQRMTRFLRSGPPPRHRHQGGHRPERHR